MPLHYVCGYLLRACVPLLACVVRVSWHVTLRCYMSRRSACVCVSLTSWSIAQCRSVVPCPKRNAETLDRTGDLQIFGLTLSQLSYRGLTKL